MLAATLVLMTALAAPEIPVKPGKDITFDGRFEAAEWADASVLPARFHDGGRLEIHIKRNGRWLALGVTSTRPYAGEVVHLQVADEQGSWIADLQFAVGQPALPPLLWRRAPPLLLRGKERRMPPECPRAARLRTDLERPDGWAAEYLVRLAAFGIGRDDFRGFRARIAVRIPGLDAPALLEFPDESREWEPETFAPLVSPDHWGRGETWAPVPRDVSREFDDNELLLRLFHEHAGLPLVSDPPELVISTATQPRSLARIEALRAALEAGQARNPTLPAWKYYLAQLYHHANFHDKAGAIIESIPPHLARLGAFVTLAAEHYFATGEWAKAFKVCDANQRTTDLISRVKAILDARRKSEAERRAIARDAEKAEPNPRARLSVAGKGDIVVELFEDDAPHAVVNFIDLVDRKFYDGLRFDEVIGGSHVGIGAPGTRDGAASGAVDPPWRLKPDESARPLLCGYLATVPAGDGPAQHGSRFIVTVVPLPDVPHGAVFGRVVEGLDVLESIEGDDRLERIEIVRRRNHSYDPRPARIQ